MTVGHDHSLTSETGQITVTAATGAVEITAATRISLRVAENSITLTPEAINLLGDILSMEAGVISLDSLGALNLQATGVVDLEAAEFVAVPPPDVPV